MSDADKFAEMDTKHDLCDEFPCRECQAENNQCPACGDYLYDAKECTSCQELAEAVVADYKKRNSIAEELPADHEPDNLWCSCRACCCGNGMCTHGE